MRLAATISPGPPAAAGLSARHDAPSCGRGRPSGAGVYPGGSGGGFRRRCGRPLPPHSAGCRRPRPTPGRVRRSAAGGGARAVVLVGADSPTLPVEYVERAFAELERADVVLGPATDGGYYLIGVGPARPPLFEGVAWGGALVLVETVATLSDPRWRSIRASAVVRRGHAGRLDDAVRSPGRPPPGRRRSRGAAHRGAGFQLGERRGLSPAVGPNRRG